MKKTCLVLTLLLFGLPLWTQTLKVATYNIRFDNPGDTLDLWVNRLPAIAGMVNLYDFDIFGTQEGLKHQLEDLKKRLPGYNYIGVGRDDGENKGEHSAIFYKVSKFTLISQGTFWLSTQTDKPNKGWDAALPRICTWGKFEVNDTGMPFFLFNTHFDHLGETARKESVILIINMVKTLAGNSPCMVTGDFNFDETHENYRLIKTSGFLNDTYDLTSLRIAPSGTFNNFNMLMKPVGRIDHIFVSNAFSVSRYGILTNTYNGRYPSDHFPVFAEVHF